MNTVLELIFRQRNLLAGLPLIAAFLSTTNEWENDWGVWGVGGALTLAGIAVRAWANQHCNYNRREQNKLATSGPYALCRNPLYVGNMLVIAGATVASEVVWMVPITLLWAFAVYTVVIRREEPRMLAKYGQAYASWCARVPRWAPVPEFGLISGARLRALRHDAGILLVLVPFVLKELKVFALWG